MSTAQATRLADELAWASLPVPTGGSRLLVLFDAADNPKLYDGRDRVRRTVLAMTPDSLPAPRPPRLEDRRPGTGVFWGIAAQNGLTVAIRVGTGGSRISAYEDALRILDRLDEMTAHTVHDPATGRRSAWLALDGRVVLVAAQPWRRPDESAGDRLLRTLRENAGRVAHNIRHLNAT
ncbi:hypothetical protein [Salinibacterium sp. ZJ454]|uniref:hypothetical protein n=1 Tax=Salinibacterium sp. ZJ454 TaxID=2708339 RepID=UPI0014218102|nr:hypothetical protein [Salinibacterium sp. ZJ454]